MRKIIVAILIVLMGMGSAIGANLPTTLQPLKSPDGRMELLFKLWDFIDGSISYSLARDGKSVVGDSRLGFELEWRDDLAHGFVIKDAQYSTFDETWAATTTTSCW